MNVHSIPVLLMFGISLYAGIFHLLFFLNKKENRENLYFALICFAIAFYDAMCFGLYNAHSVTSGIGWQRGQYFAFCCLAVPILYFVFALTEKKKTWLFKILVSFIYFLVAAGLLFPSRIWDLQTPNIKNIEIFNLHITYFEAGSALLMNLAFVFIIAATIYVFYILLASYLRRKRKDLLPLLIGLVVYLISAFLDVLITNDMIHFIYISEYSFIILIFMMDFSFQKRFVRLFHEVEAMNVELEDRVKARTDEINKLLTELSLANEEMEEKNIALQELSEHDSLTKLLNHAAFHGRLAEVFNAAKRQHFPLAVLMIDIDHFKEINDQYGHPLGDRIIIKVAEVLLGSSRNYDVKARYSEEKKKVPPASIRKYDVAGRYGGDEFSVLLPYCGENETKIIAERIHKHINGIVLEDTPNLQISVSMGGVVFDQKVMPDNEGILIQQADQALYQAKKGGRNQVVINRLTGKGL
ncbi:MAG: GGDEF domain-containing protein [Candidatus Aminicenantes bacterium]|nr:GGDEF domain-containing protein [Candidatus Aminicenantes bacterium]